MDDPLSPQRAVARYLASLALAVVGAALAWFAYIDAPISDAVMLWVALGVALGVVAALAGLAALAVSFGTAATAGPPGETLQRRLARLRRIALLALAVALLVLGAAALATLNLRGTGTDSGEQDTSVAV